MCTYRSHCPLLQSERYDTQISLDEIVVKNAVSLKSTDEYRQLGSDDSSGVTTPKDSFTVECSTAMDEAFLVAMELLLAALALSWDRLRFHFAGSIVPQSRFTFDADSENAGKESSKNGSESFACVV
eukprot:m.336366 g.336366  ORF g.336366 m.336366 type:complete len:127 (+) comp20534_c0_seq2:518-898(+)